LIEKIPAIELGYRAGMSRRTRDKADKGLFDAAAKHADPNAK